MTARSNPAASIRRSARSGGLSHGCPGTRAHACARPRQEPATPRSPSYERRRSWQGPHQHLLTPPTEAQQDRRSTPRRIPGVDPSQSSPELLAGIGAAGRERPRAIAQARHAQTSCGLPSLPNHLFRSRSGLNAACSPLARPSRYPCIHFGSSYGLPGVPPKASIVTPWDPGTILRFCAAPTRVNIPGSSFQV